MDEGNTNKQEIDGNEGSRGAVQNQLPELTETDMLSSKIAELENNANQYKEQMLRKAAEFENYKKRIENESANIVKYANEDLLEKLLPVLDDFDRSLSALKNPNLENENLIKGIELIFNKLKRMVELQGVKHFESLGRPFDPEYHDALLQVPSKEHPANTVMQEVEKGYLLHDKVLRHAKVVVSSDPQQEEIRKDSLSEND